MKSKSSPSPEESRRSGEGLASAITISLLSMLLYVNTLNHQFVYDDRYLTRRIIHQNIVIICQSARRRGTGNPHSCVEIQIFVNADTFTVTSRTMEPINCISFLSAAKFDKF